MELILWRHAESEEGGSDETRKLTANGLKQAEKIAGFLRQHVPDKHRMLVSPAARAQQTAATLSNHFTSVPAIGPGASAQAVLLAAGWPNAGGTIVVVGHQPTLGEAAALLLGSSDSVLNIRKGAIWWFSYREKDGRKQTELRLAISPEFL